MYAIILTGGKQYKVAENDTVRIEKLDSSVGSTVEFDRVLMVVNGDQVDIGAPYLSGTKVTGEIVKAGRDEKISIIKFRRRKHYMRRAGHRQSFTEVKISSIVQK